MDQDRTETYQRRIKIWLGFTDLTEERTEYLSNHENVLRDLSDSLPDDWDLALAVALHVAFSDQYQPDVFLQFQEEGTDHVNRLVIETEEFRPSLKITPEGTAARYYMNRQNPRWSTYVYSRIALAVLMSRTDPEHAIELYEAVSSLFSPALYDRIILEPFWLASDLVQRRLAGIYEKVERYEDALNLLLPSSLEIGWKPSQMEKFQPIIRSFHGWLMRLVDSGGITDVKRFIDLAYRLVQKVDGIDQEEREQLNDCPPDTRQYWAWHYGYSLGQLVVRRPSLRTSLIEELSAQEWSDGWAAGGVLFDAPQESWEEHRQIALQFYLSADIEYGREGNSTSLRSNRPFDARQPPHLSAQSDLYWAMRVGFADAHIDGRDERRPTLSGIADAVERVETIASMTAQHALRTEYQMDLHWEVLEKGLPPSPEYWRQQVQRVLGHVWEQLPTPTVEHLTDAMDKGYRKDRDAQRIATAKAVEALFEEIMRPKLAGQEMYVLQRGKEPDKRRLDRYRPTLHQWAELMNTVSPQQLNESIGTTLKTSWPNLDMQTVSDLAGPLHNIGRLRGTAAHHSSESEDEKTKKSEELWSLVVDGVGREGFLVRFCYAFGLAEPGPSRKGR